MDLEIVYETEDLIAINKPNGLLVHRSSMARDATEFAVQSLRDQVGYQVFPVHRLDRKTSGILLFTKERKLIKEVQALFLNGKVKKVYHAIVRGYTEEDGTIDYALVNDRGKLQDSITHYRRLKTYEIPFPSAGHDTSRYSLVELIPETGRFHQLRKHMAHIFHPIIGDRPHGCNKQNRIWKNNFKLSEMLLHAVTLELQRTSNERTIIKADYSEAFRKAVHFLDEQNL